MSTPGTRLTPAWVFRLAVVTVCVGIGSGIGGLLVSVSLHAIEHLAYGYSRGDFLGGVIAAGPGRRVFALAIAGVIGGVGWWALRRFAAPVVSIEKAVDGVPMRTRSTLVNVVLQVVIVGLGASIGREVAPRELGALIAGWITRRSGISAREARILVACGAGAGLAAVYNVPLAGALFTIEILLAELSFATAVPAIATAAIAALIARLAVPGTPVYSLPPVHLTPSLVVWAVVVGPILGFSAAGFVRLARFAADHRAANWTILIVMPVVFTGVGVLSIPFPQILGNGISIGELAFAGGASFLIMALFAVLKTITTAATIGAGAAGGTLTPALVIGAAIGVALGGLWSLFWPGTSLAAFAFVAAAAFLSSSLGAPITALMLLIEFTQQGPELLIPGLLAIAGSVAVTHYQARRRLAGID